MSSYKYREVIFLQDPAEFDKWYVEFDEDSSQGFDYLLQWEHGDDGVIRKEPPWGTADDVEYFQDGDNDYAISYNWHLSYVGLTQIIREES